MGSYGTDTLDAIRTYGTRNPRTLREIAADQAAHLRAATATRPAGPTRTRVERQVAEARAAAAAAGTVRRPAPSTVVERPTYKQVDELAAQVPVGLYALPRVAPSAVGNTVTFFKVHPFRGGKRIVQLVGSIGAFAEQTLPVHLQFHALRHIAEDAHAASILFGRETATCGVCGSPLTNETSRKAGIGPKCARKF